MDSQTMAAWAATLLTGLIAAGSLLARLTIHGSARTHVQRADLLRRLQLEEQAEVHERTAREYLLRPIVIKERAIVGLVSWADIITLLLFLGMLTTLPVLGPTLASIGIFLALVSSMIAINIWDGRAVKRACSSRAATYEAPVSTPVDQESTNSVLGTALPLLLLTLCLRRVR